MADSELHALLVCLAPDVVDQVTVEDVMQPGPQRNRLVTQLLQALLGSSSLDVVLARIDAVDAQHLSAEERQAHRLVTLLNSLGQPATADQLLGFASYRDSMAFLQRLAGMVASLQALRQATCPVTKTLTPPRAGATSSTGGAAGKATATARLLERACEQLSCLVSEDAAKRVLACGEPALGVLQQGCHQLQRRLEQAVAQLQAGDIGEHGMQGGVASGQGSQDQWEAHLQRCAAALSDFNAAVHRFTAVYHRELGVWCASSEPPQTLGLGQSADAMQGQYMQLIGLLRNLEVMRDMHAAVTASGPPLQAFSPKVMLQVAAQGQTEAARLAQELEVLRACVGR